MMQSTNKALEWSDAFVLGYDPMDAVHEEFAQLLNAAHDSTDAQLPRALNELVEHLESHFGTEDELMRLHEFPPRDCHIDEHAAVLKSAHEVLGMLPMGEGHVVARTFIRSLASWFPGHSDYLDAALAHWMVKRLHGGKPVVLRRQIVLGRIPAEALET